MLADAAHLAASIPAPPFKQFHLGPFLVRMYALCLLAGIAAAIWLSHRRWTRRGGDPDLPLEVGLWGAIAGVIGGRIYHDITSWDQLGPEWWAPFAVWKGGLGIWGGIAAGVLAGAWVVRRNGASVMRMMDVAAPGIVLAQGIGRLGNWFNQELFGGPTSLPWGLEVDPAFRPDGYESAATFHPTFAYEGLWNVAVCIALIVIGRRMGDRLRPPGLFCLYVILYCAGRIVCELLRVDPSHHILGQRLNFWVALVVLLGGVAALVWTQRRPGPDPPPVSERTTTA
ncbi:MAG: prolipoprotein diacylglyceryl transferase [Thermoleophilia bacterium]|nr:prolipoprotein diacylglyceryl transferase [Thermoleophilia bacterium]